MENWEVVYEEANADGKEGNNNWVCYDGILQWEGRPGHAAQWPHEDHKILFQEYSNTNDGIMLIDGN